MRGGGSGDTRPAALRRIVTARSIVGRAFAGAAAGFVVGALVAVAGESNVVLSGLGEPLMILALAVGAVSLAAVPIILHATCPYCRKPVFNRWSWLGLFRSNCYTCGRRLDGRPGA